MCLLNRPNFTLQYKTRHHMLQEARNTLAKVNKRATLVGMQCVSTTLAACVFVVSLQMFHWFICGSDRNISEVLKAKHRHHLHTSRMCNVYTAAQYSYISVR